MHPLEDSIQYYREQGAPEDQQMLIALLREVQQQCGGVLTPDALDVIAAAYGVKKSLLTALIRRAPSLRLASVPHRLEVCGTCPKGHALRAFIENTWHVQNGCCCEAAGFSYHVTGCMKNCRKGPSLRWDGELYPQADEALVRRLLKPASKT